MKKLRGPKYRNSQIVYAQFFCANCKLNCYRQKQKGLVYDGAWEPWVPQDDSQVIATGATELAPFAEVCKHAHLITLFNNISESHETRTFECLDCMLSCTRTREIGHLVYGPWKEKTLA